MSDNGTGKLSELQATKMELFALRHRLLIQQMQANLAERTALLEKIEAEHPGYHWHDSTGRLVSDDADQAPPA